jgi:glutathione synthase/RimK-type ligase-like ATP-grasp enzyme
VTTQPRLAVLYEHTEWQKPLFAALERASIDYAPVDLKGAAFSEADSPTADLYFNQASPSAYVRGNARAVPYVLAYMRHLESGGALVLNGSRAFELELSKTAQARLLRRLGVDHPRSVTFNAVEALQGRADLRWPAMLKPEQGGSGARMQVVRSLDELQAILAAEPGRWLPDNLLLLQEYLEHDPDRGVVRLEFVGGELLYAMRVITHGRFNLCPSVVCNPLDGSISEEALCELPQGPPVEFYAYPDVPAEAIATAERIFAAAGLDVGGIEYLETADGRRVFYDINANSNLREPVARDYGGFDPFDRVAVYLAAHLQAGHANSTSRDTRPN